MKNPNEERFYLATERAAVVFGDKDKADEWLKHTKSSITWPNPFIHA